MMAKPIRALELHYPMIQYIIKAVILLLKLNVIIDIRFNSTSICRHDLIGIFSTTINELKSVSGITYEASFTTFCFVADPNKHTPS